MELTDEYVLDNENSIAYGDCVCKAFSRRSNSSLPWTRSHITVTQAYPKQGLTSHLQTRTSQVLAPSLLQSPDTTHASLQVHNLIHAHPHMAEWIHKNKMAARIAPVKNSPVHQ